MGHSSLRLTASITAFDASRVGLAEDFSNTKGQYHNKTPVLGNTSNAFALCATLQSIMWR
jgi:hypothetical protein